MAELHRDADDQPEVRLDQSAPARSRRSNVAPATGRADAPRRIESGPSRAGNGMAGSISWFGCSFMTGMCPSLISLSESYCFVPCRRHYRRARLPLPSHSSSRLSRGFDARLLLRRRGRRAPREDAGADAGDELLEKSAEHELAADGRRLERRAREERTRQEIAHAERNTDGDQRLLVDEVAHGFAQLLGSLARAPRESPSKFSPTRSVTSSIVFSIAGLLTR